jgi:hypothetical protein
MTLRNIKPKAISKPKFLMFVIALLAFTILPIINAPLPIHAVTDCSPQGITYSGSSWLQGGGVNICNHPGDSSANYINNNSGVSTLSGYKWECVEMVNRLYLTQGWITSNWYGNGNTLINYLPAGLTSQANGNISYINSGDAITLDDGGYGHVAIIDTISGSTYSIISQNAILTSTASIGSGSLSGGNASLAMSGWAGYSVQAIAHHPGGGATAHGTGTVGQFNPTNANFYLSNSNATGHLDDQFQFGGGGWKPVVGDWNADGVDTIGAVDPSTQTFYLRNANNAGTADAGTPQFGAGGWIPIAGDWDGIPGSGIGQYDPATSTFYLRNNPNSGVLNTSFQYGAAGDMPVVGDWNGDGIVTIGVFRPSNATFYLRDANNNGSATYAFQYGGGGYKPVTGDWNGDGASTIGVVDPSSQTFYLRNSNNSGTADAGTPQFGAAGWVPTAGDWDGL